MHGASPMIGSGVAYKHLFEDSCSETGQSVKSRLSQEDATATCGHCQAKLIISSPRRGFAGSSNSPSLAFVVY